MMHEIEVWKPIDGYNGIYEVSNLGNVRSLNRKVDRERAFLKKGILLKPQVRGRYLKVDLTKLKNVKQISIHRLVAKAFVENKLGKPYVNHKNGIRTDNRAINLEWVTQKENISHYNNTLGNNFLGENHSQSVLTSAKVLEIRNKYIPKLYSSRKLATEYNISQYTVLSIIKYRTWKHVK